MYDVKLIRLHSITMKRQRPASLRDGGRPKLWLPSEGALGHETDKADVVRGDSGTAKQSDDDDDDLDRLLDKYEAQAAEELAQVQHAEQRRQPGRQSATARREAALEQPLAEDNKGFKMLAAMGYQPGRGLGKSVKGRAEPIPLDLKQDKLGLGRVSKKAAARDAQKQREKEASERIKHAQHIAEASIHAGRQRSAEQFAARREAGQLRKAQQVCESLDVAAGITSNHIWQPPPEDETATTAAAPDLPNSTHLPGRWRPTAAAHQPGGRLPQLGFGGLSGAAEDELLEEAEFFRRDLTGPGQEADARWCTGSAVLGEGLGPASVSETAQGHQHGATGGPGGAPPAAEAADAAAAGWHELPVRQQLEDVLRYLREQYAYCLYCGCRYEDTTDLYEHCPGMLEADHE